MTLVTPHIGNNVSCVKRINDECHFSWQAQYWVTFRGRRNNFGMIAGARNVVFFNTKCSWWA